MDMKIDSSSASSDRYSFPYISAYSISQRKQVKFLIEIPPGSHEAGDFSDSKWKLYTTQDQAQHNAVLGSMTSQWKKEHLDLLNVVYNPLIAYDFTFDSIPASSGFFESTFVLFSSDNCHRCLKSYSRHVES